MARLAAAPSCAVPRRGAAKRARSLDPPQDVAFRFPAPEGAGPHWPWASAPVDATGGAARRLYCVMLAHSPHVSMDAVKKEVWSKSWTDAPRVPEEAGPGNAYFTTEQAALDYVKRLHRERPRLAKAARLVIRPGDLPHEGAYLDALAALYAECSAELTFQNTKRAAEALPRFAEALRRLFNPDGHKAHADQLADWLVKAWACAQGRGYVFGYVFTQNKTEFVFGLPDRKLTVTVTVSDDAARVRALSWLDSSSTAVYIPFKDDADEELDAVLMRALEGAGVV
jgi:hypothetical protein